MLFEVPHHLFVLVLRNLSAGVSFPDDVEGVVSVTPVPPSIAPSPGWPDEPSYEPEDGEYPEEGEDSAEWEEVGIEAYGCGSRDEIDC